MANKSKTRERPFSSTTVAYGNYIGFCPQQTHTGILWYNWSYPLNPTNHVAAVRWSAPYDNNDTKFLQLNETC